MSIGTLGINSDGTVDSTWQSPLGVPPLTPSTSCLIKDQNDQLYVSGYFSAYTPLGVIPREGRANFARLNSDGTLDTSFPQIARRSNAIFTDANGTLFVGGDNFLYKYGPNGVADPNFNAYEYVTQVFELSDYPDPDQEEAENGNMYADAGTLDLVYDSESPWNWRGDQVIGLHFKPM